jgi:hypothetical protein
LKPAKLESSQRQFQEKSLGQFSYFLGYPAFWRHDAIIRLDKLLRAQYRQHRANNSCFFLLTAMDWSKAGSVQWQQFSSVHAIPESYHCGALAFIKNKARILAKCRFPHLLAIRHSSGSTFAVNLLSARIYVCFGVPFDDSRDSRPTGKIRLFARRMISEIWG